MSKNCMKWNPIMLTFSVSILVPEQLDYVPDLDFGCWVSSRGFLVPELVAGETFGSYLFPRVVFRHFLDFCALKWF